MIFMRFNTTSVANPGMEKIWLAIEHIASVRTCPEQADHSLIEMDSGYVHEVDGYAEDILREIVNECRER